MRLKTGFCDKVGGEALLGGAKGYIDVVVTIR